MVIESLIDRASIYNLLFSLYLLKFSKKFLCFIHKTHHFVDFSLLLYIVIRAVVVVVGAVHMCITFDKRRNDRLEWVWCLCINMCIICVKNRDLCTDMHRVKLSTQFKHDLDTSYAQALYCSVTLSCTFFDYLTLAFKGWQ